MSGKIKALSLELYLPYYYNYTANYCNIALICITVLKGKLHFVNQKKQVLILTIFNYTVQISQLYFQCFAVEIPIIVINNTII